MNKDFENIRVMLAQHGSTRAMQALRRLHRGMSNRKISLTRLYYQFATLIQYSHPVGALEILKQILLVEPHNAQVHLLEAVLSDRVGNHGQARAAALKIITDDVSANPTQKILAANLLVRLLDDPVAMETALEAYDSIDRPLGLAGTMLYIAQKSARWDVVQQLIEELKVAYRDNIKLREAKESPRTHVLWCDDEKTNIKVISNWSELSFKPKNNSLQVEPIEGRKIRIGYLSSDYREHPTSRLINGLLRNHDRTKFELHMYCSGWDDGSAMRREVESHFDFVHSVTHLSDDRAAELIRSHKIDVLVELNGPTRANRMGILAERAAPVQIDYLGWPGSVGGRVVDYVVGDHYTVPDGAEKLYPERLIRLEKIYQVNDYAAQVLPDPPARSALGLPNDAIVLGMFNAINKVRAEVWQVWMNILRQVPGSMLWILDPGKAARQYIGAYTRSLGIDPKRILAAPAKGQLDHLARLQQCDLMLDPWPYGGHTSTSDALFAGVPVVALNGTNFAGRVSAGLLCAAGLKQLVANDLEEYQRLVIHLLRDRPLLDKVKHFIKTETPKRDIFNAVGKARQLEQAYVYAISRVISGQPPIHINTVYYGSSDHD